MQSGITTVSWYNYHITYILLFIIDTTGFVHSYITCCSTNVKHYTIIPSCSIYRPMNYYHYPYPYHYYYCPRSPSWQYMSCRAAQGFSQVLFVSCFMFYFSFKLMFADQLHYWEADHCRPLQLMFGIKFVSIKRIIADSCPALHTQCLWN